MNRSHRFFKVIAIAVPILLSIALVCVCIWAGKQAEAAEQTLSAQRIESESAYRQAAYRLGNDINDMQTALKKLQVTASKARHVLLLSDVWRLSGSAVANMGCIPSSHVETSDLNQFIVRTGDYAHVSMQRILNGGVLTQEDYSTLDKLYEASVQIGNAWQTHIDNNDFAVEAIDIDGYYAAPGSDSTDAQPAQSDPAGQSDQAGQSEESISDYPTLIYDGPFSESNERAEPRGLSDQTVDENAAKQAALGYLGGGSLTATGVTEGIIPTFGFQGTNAEGRSVELTVTRQGGQVLWMMADSEGNAEGVPDERTVETLKGRAKAFLDGHGYAGMEAAYAQFYSGIAVFNFAATEGDVILYPDLVKVYVEQQNGAIVGVDATNYLMAHRVRTLPSAELSQEEAATHVSDALEVQAVRLALIPKTAQTEVLCYEFKGSYRGLNYIVYINALNGNEEELFEIIDSDQGQMVV